MSTFLELCQDLRQEAGISGADGTPTAVTGQTGELKRCVDWISKSYEEIQSAHNNWLFLRDSFSFETIAATIDYTPSSINLDEFESWWVDTFRCYLTSLGTIDEQWLVFVPWERFRDEYLFAANRDVTGRPTHFTIRPDDTITVWPKPDANGYTITGDYQKRPHVMTANGDEPVFPRQFHKVVMWNALMLYGAWESAPELYAHGERQSKKLMFRLRRNQLPAVSVGGPLA